MASRSPTLKLKSDEAEYTIESAYSSQILADTQIIYKRSTFSYLQTVANGVFRQTAYLSSRANWFSYYLPNYSKAIVFDFCIFSWLRISDYRSYSWAGTVPSDVE